MALRTWVCKDCGAKTILLDYEEKVCSKCGSTNISHIIDVPQEDQILELDDETFGVQNPRGIREDVRAKAKLHHLETAEDRIREFGEEEAIKSGDLISDDGGETYRLKTVFDCPELLGRRNITSPLENTRDITDE